MNHQKETGKRRKIMSTVGGKPNILLLIADDLGLDLVDVYGRGTSKAMDVVTYDNSGVEIRGHLPTISRFLRNGLNFKQAWAQPACSPTRASLYTGLHPWKHGVGSPYNNPELSASSSLTTLPEMLPGEYVSALFGKWHLGMRAGTYPTDHGWDLFNGSLGGQLEDYNEWTNPQSDHDYYPADRREYATWATAKDAAEWINDQNPDLPWFATLAFNAPHAPFHVPRVGSNPSYAFGYNESTSGDQSTADYKFNVMTQCLDKAIGVLIGDASFGFAGSYDFDPIPPEQLKNTVIFFLGDNGSPREVAIQEPKKEIYEGGIEIPLIIADGRAVLQEMRGNNINPLYLDSTKLNGRTNRLVNVVDLYKTIIKLADPDADNFPSNLDSRDLCPLLQNPGPQAPVRRHNFAQFFKDGDPNEKRATIRNTKYKLNYDARNNPVYSFYEYENREVDGREDDGSAVDIYNEAIHEVGTERSDNLNALMDELIQDYQINQDEEFPDTRTVLA
jgi:arylsulfatase A-like enzyme